jgi:Fibronectin type III domain/Kelch motif/Galactose oxidase, central domain
MLSSPRSFLVAAAAVVALALPAVVPGSVAAATPSPGTGWRDAGAVITPRSDGAVATALPDGRVLLEGGRDSNGRWITDAEVFDPSSGRWTATGSLRQARGADHTATLLADGRVLVVGGQCDNCWQTGSATNRAEIYDPARGTFTEVAPMSVARYRHSATLLADGRVLVVGGYGGQAWATAEVFDPARGIWSPTAPMAVSRHLHAAVRLPDGRVLVSGGWCDPSCPEVAMASAEIYDPATNRFTATAPMRMPRMQHTLHLLPNGKVLNVGGWTPSTGGTEKTELYRIDRGTWSAGPPTMLRRFGPSILTRSGRVLIVAGDSAESYDAAANQWRYAGTLRTTRSDFALAHLPDGGVLTVAGAVGCFPNCMAPNAERYDGTTEAAVPYPPTGLLANNGNKSITFSWKRPTRTGGHSVTGYMLRITPAKGGEPFFVKAGKDKTKVTVRGLTNGVRYSAVVAAVNQAGQSFWSRSVSATPAPGP